ncbi:MAG: hypothetical protein J7K22_02980 [Nanoarchaeota archaeon]|nr:hypothetical protein [Nanoarchaeota archaeon]
MQNELRKSVDSENWSLISQIEPSSVGCALCPVSDEKVEETFRIEDEKGRWVTKSIVDPYPVTHPTSFKLKENGLFQSYNAHGWSEIVVETRDHSKEFHELSSEEIKNVLLVYVNRIKELRKRDGVLFIGIVKDNQRLEFDHSYSKIFTLPILPRVIKEKIEKFEDYQYKYEKCIYCDIIEKEKDTSRFIFDNEHFIVITPFSQNLPNQVLIFPKKHYSCLTQLSDYEIFSLAETIKNILTRFSAAFKPLKYSMVFYIKPNKSEDFHFHISISQKTFHSSIKEGYDISFNRFSPEDTAKILRGG